MLHPISIPTALAGCDAPHGYGILTGAKFQSPQPSRAVTEIDALPDPGAEISIPTALAGCDPLRGL